MRYLPHTSEDVAEMLELVGAGSIDDLFDSVPEAARRPGALALPEALTEWELTELMQRLAGKNAGCPKVYLGAGSYEHFIPESIRYLSSRSEFVTAYTPYQPEISQGTLQAIFEYQTLLARLLGLDVTNASMYDGASALAEALLMTIRISKKKKKAAVSRLVHPFYRRVVQTYFKPTGYELIELPYLPDGTTDLGPLKDIDDLAGLAIQSPNFFGVIENLRAAADLAHDKGALLAASFTEPLAFGLLKSPGRQGADIACGEGQSFGLSSSFGGPGLGVMACKMDYVRNIPGRLVGETTDLDGRRSFVLTLAAREQHIRREKAVSNICTNASHSALTAAMYLASLGSSGIRELAALNRDKAEYLKNGLKKAGLEIVFSGPTFHEFVFRPPEGFEIKMPELLKKGIVPGLDLGRWHPELAGCRLVCVTETKSKEDLDALVKEITS